jgi:hypothetical protein
MNTAKLAVEVKGTDVEEVNPQGQKANTNGQKLEDRVELALRKLGVNFIQHRDYDPTAFNTERLCIKNAPHITPYGGRGRHEFELHNVVPGKVRIECRSQYVAGTADEKLLYLFESVLIGTENVAWIIFDGDGFKPGAKETIRKKAEAVKHKKIKVFNSFKHWESWINVVLGTHSIG